MKNLKMYILINEDVKLSKGKLAGQVGHAVATMFYNQHLKTGGLLPVMKDYMEGDQKKIILKCPESKLCELEKQGYIAIRDKGYTELEPGTLTCVNLGLLDGDLSIPKEIEFIKDLKLL